MVPNEGRGTGQGQETFGVFCLMSIVHGSVLSQRGRHDDAMYAWIN